MAPIRDPALAAGMPGAYLPILPTGHSELSALRNLDRRQVELVVPILHLRERESARYFLDRINHYLPAGLHVGLDLVHLPDSDYGEPHPVRVIAEHLANRDVPAYPVVRLTDSTIRLAHQKVASELHDDRAIVRLNPFGERPGALAAGLERIRRTSRLEPEQCDLLLDLGRLDPHGHLGAVEQRVLRVLDWAGKTPWRMVTLAAGAMPPRLPFLPAGVASRITRWDALLWRHVAATGVGYGDYGIGAPGGGHEEDRPVLPYTVDGEWRIYRWPRFMPPKREWVPEVDATLSWGDHEIARRAHLSHEAGSDWHAWGTSHHLAHVLGELRAAGEPGAADEAR